MRASHQANTANPLQHPCLVRTLGTQTYLSALHQMQAFTDSRDANTPDEIWQVSHPPCFTLGQAGKPEHILNAGDIPVYQSDRGGQVTYHGPGQCVIYVLFDLKRLHIGIKALVNKLEQAVIDYLATEFSIHANNDPCAPGVYVNGAKICALGLRVRRGCSYHGIAFNVDMDRQPYTRINPCGTAGLRIAMLKDYVSTITLNDLPEMSNTLSEYILKHTTTTIGAPHVQHQCE